MRFSLMYNKAPLTEGTLISTLTSQQVISQNIRTNLMRQMQPKVP